MNNVRHIWGNFSRVFFLSASLVACGGGGDSADNFSKARELNCNFSGCENLDGNWFASYRDDSGMYHTATFFISTDASGKTVLADLVIDGGSTSLVATIGIGGSNEFEVAFSDGNEAVILVDSQTSPSHATFMDIENNIGVIERDATMLPGDFALTDVAGTWTGNQATYGQNLSTSTLNTAFDITVSNDMALNFSSANGRFSGSFSSSYNSSVATYTGNYAKTFSGSTTVENGDVFVMLSPDKTFMALFACQVTSSFPLTCIIVNATKS